MRARFSAILKKDVGYLVKTTSPAFHSFHYGGEPGASLGQLREDMQRTVNGYEYSNLKIREVHKGAGGLGKGDGEVIGVRGQGE